jgi:hypothetical protein
MKKIIFTILVSFVGLTYFSCTETLDLEPVSEISSGSFWKTESDVQGMLAGMYTQLRNEATQNLFVWGELRSDALGTSVGSAIWQNWYLNILTPENSGANYFGMSQTWAGLYKIIHSCNLILKYGPSINFSSENVKNDAIAQAYTMRAYAYFVMARTWGGVPLITEPASGKLDDIQKTRASIEDVFELIKDDIDKGTNLFGRNDFVNGRAMWSLPALYALKAEVYLWTGKELNGGNNDFNTALDACNKVQESDVELLPDFASVFEYTNKKNKEIIFAISRNFEETPSEPYIYKWMAPAEIFLPADVDEETKEIFEPYSGTPFMGPSDNARNIFLEGDKRKNSTLHEVYTNASGSKTFHSSYLMKFKGTVISGIRYYTDDYILYRYADVLLMKAEVKNALNQDPAPEINEIRKRAYGDQYTNYVFTSGSKIENDAEILNERFRELMFEGKRWWDLVRFDKAFDLVPSLQDRKGQEHLLLFPIPIETISLNTKLAQNTGYE